MNQECPTLDIGETRISHPARPNEDIARMQEKGVNVYVVRDDIEERGIDEKNCVAGIQLIRTRDLGNLMEEHDQVWHW